MKQKRIILIGYKIGSRSLKNLQAQLREDQQQRRVLRVRKTSLTYRRRLSDHIVAWGPTAPCPHTDAQQEVAKKIAANKLLSFQKFREHGVSTPEWTTSLEEAQDWIDSGKMVVGRKLLRSHSGKGIILFDQETITSDKYCKLYVQYKKKKHEYRVHVYKSKVVDVTQKKRRAGFENRNNQIRNHQNGWVYCRENLSLPAGIEDLAKNACAALNLHSGAVDIIWNEKEDKCYVLEINTAPGIEGTTCKKYSTNILEALNG